MEVAYDGIMARRRARGDEAMAAVFTQAGEGEVARRMLECDDLEVLVARMLQAAIDSALPSKRRLLARIFRECLDGDRVDGAVVV
jgi:hypothetical protein